MRQYEPRTPAGLVPVCDAVQEICDSARMYHFTGFRPDPFLIRLDSGSGRSCVVRYITDMFRMHEVLDFASSRTDCLELKLDGTLPQLRQALEEIHAAAEYDNCYREVIAMEISALADHLNETQTEEFLTAMETVCAQAFVIFFVHRVPTAREERLIKLLYDHVPVIRSISTDEYTSGELAEITARIVEENGIEIRSRDEFVREAETVLQVQETTQMPKAKALALRLIRRADYSSAFPYVGEEAIRAEYKPMKGVL